MAESSSTPVEVELAVDSLLNAVEAADLTGKPALAWMARRIVAKFGLNIKFSRSNWDPRVNGLALLKKLQQRLGFAKPRPKNPPVSDDEEAARWCSKLSQALWGALATEHGKLQDERELLRNAANICCLCEHGFCNERCRVENCTRFVHHRCFCLEFPSSLVGSPGQCDEHATSMGTLRVP